MPEEQFPKLLVVDGSALSPSGNMGILKTHLLLNWPGDRIAHVVTSGQKDYHSKASRQFVVTKRGILFRKSGFEFHQKDGLSQSNILTRTNPESSTIHSLLNRLRLKLNMYLYKFYKPITHYHRSSAGVFSTRLFSFVESVKPDLILTLGGTLPELKTAYLLSRKYKLPLVMYITDDYIGWTYTDIYFSGYFRSQLEKYFRLCLSSSIARFTVGFKMEKEYLKRYQLEFKTIMDGIDTSLYRERPEKENRSEILFYYIGSLEPNRWHNLHQIGLAIADLNASQMQKSKLIIHSFKNEKINHGKKFEDIECVEFRDPVPFMEVAQYQMRADILIHVESFEEATTFAMTKYSISTKIFQYLAAGTPILAFGPADLASIEFLREQDAAIIVDLNEMDKLKENLLYMINNLATLQTAREKSRTYALNNLSIEATGRQFATEVLNRYVPTTTPPEQVGIRLVDML